MIEGRHFRRWSVSIGFVLVWTIIFTVVLYFVVGTPYQPPAMMTAFSGMIASGIFLAWKSGHLPAPKHAGSDATAGRRAAR